MHLETAENCYKVKWWMRWSGCLVSADNLTQCSAKIRSHRGQLQQQLPWQRREQRHVTCQRISTSGNHQTLSVGLRRTTWRISDSSTIC